MMTNKDINLLKIEEEQSAKEIENYKNEFAEYIKKIDKKEVSSFAANRKIRKTFKMRINDFFNKFINII